MEPRFSLQDVLGGFSSDALSGRTDIDPQARTKLLGIGNMLRELHEQGGISRGPGQFSPEQLMQLAQTYMRRQAPVGGGLDSPTGPLLQDKPGSYGDTSVIDAIARARAGRGQQQAAGPGSAPPPPQAAAPKLFAGDYANDPVRHILQQLAERTGTNYMR